MKKDFKFYIISWAILVVIFNVAVFAIPNEMAGISKFNGAFWSGYVFITLAFIGQFICAAFAFKAETPSKLFLSIPIITISYFALIISIVIGLICMLIPVIPNWIGIILCVLVLGISAVSVISAQSAAAIINENEKKVTAETSFIKSLSIDAKNLIAHAKTDESNSAAKKVYEAIRYSDPISNKKLNDIEEKIKKEFNVFANAVMTDNTSDIVLSKKEIIALIADRNSKCKMLK